MEKILLALILILCLGNFASASINAEVEDSNGETSEFWPPDMIPHPHPHPREEPEDNMAHRM